MIDTPAKVAAIRASLLALGTGLFTFFVMLPQTEDWRLIVSAVGTAALGPLLGRGVIEGLTDQQNPDQRAADKAKAH